MSCCVGDGGQDTTIQHGIRMGSGKMQSSRGLKNLANRGPFSGNWGTSRESNYSNRPRRCGVGAFMGIRVKSVAKSLALVAGVAVLAGCQADVTTNIQVPDDARLETVVVELALGGPAKDTFADPALATRLDNLIEKRFGEAEKTQTETELRYKGTIQTTTLRGVSGLVGVSDAIAEKTESGIQTTIITTEATELKEALLAIDDPAGWQTAIETIKITAIINTPGPITNVTGGEVKWENNKAVIENTLENWGDGTYLIQSEAETVLPWWIWVGGALLIAGIFVVIAKKRKNQV